MARTARLHYPGGVFHVISRCVEGRCLLGHQALRAAYVSLLGRVVERTDARVLGYCIMSNHTHVVLAQGRDALSRVFRPLNTGLAWQANRRRKGEGAKGPVFAQRPRTVLVDEESYLLELIRYVHNNPVRAGVVRRASDSSWSSHRAYVGLDACPHWLHAGYVLSRFGGTRERAVAAFDAFVGEGSREARRADFSGASFVRAERSATKVLGDAYRVSDGVLGDEAFLRRVSRDMSAVEDAIAAGPLRRRLDEEVAPQAMLPWVSEVVCGVLSLERHELDFRSQQHTHGLARRLLTWVWLRRLGGRQVDIARELRASSSVVSRWYASALRLEPELDPLADEVVRQLRRCPQGLGTLARTSRLRFEVLVDE